MHLTKATNAGNLPALASGRSRCCEPRWFELKGALALLLLAATLPLTGCGDTEARAAAGGTTAAPTQAPVRESASLAAVTAFGETADAVSVWAEKIDDGWNLTFSTAQPEESFDDPCVLERGGITFSIDVPIEGPGTYHANVDTTRALVVDRENRSNNEWWSGSVTIDSANDEGAAGTVAATLVDMDGGLSGPFRAIRCNL